MINVKFRSKNPVNGSRYRSTRNFHGIVEAHFKTVFLGEKQIEITGVWTTQDSNGNSRKVNDINFKYPAEEMKNIEYKLGEVTAQHTYSYVDKRLAQYFPLQLEKEFAEDNKANFGLRGNDIELIN